jgi:hypothetical protein
VWEPIQVGILISVLMSVKFLRGWGLYFVFDIVSGAVLSAFSFDG